MRECVLLFVARERQILVICLKLLLLMLVAGPILAMLQRKLMSGPHERAARLAFVHLPRQWRQLREALSRGRLRSAGRHVVDAFRQWFRWLRRSHFGRLGNLLLRIILIFGGVAALVELGFAIVRCSATLSNSG